MPINLELHENFDGTLDGRYKQGDKPNAASGGTPALAWSAPQGLADGNTLTITTDGTYSFGVAPSFCTLGFGTGTLATSAINDPLNTVVDPISGNTMVYERDGSPTTQSRYIVEKDGIRALRAANITGASGSIGGGMVSWDYGQEIPINTPVLFSSWVRAKAASVADSPSSSSQWKTYRIRSEFALNDVSGVATDNSGYHKSFSTPANINNTNEGEFTNYNVGGSAETQYSLTHPMFNDKWTRHDLLLKSGTLDNADGYIMSRGIIPSDASGIIEMSATRNLYESGTTSRWRWMNEQCYAQFCTDPEIWRTDYFYQVGTFARFELANGATPATTTDAKILPPTAWAGNSVSLRLYKQMFTDYSGKYIHYYDSNGDFVTGVAI